MFLLCEEGQGLAEYALIIILLAVLLISCLTVFGTAAVDFIKKIRSKGD